MEEGNWEKFKKYFAENVKTQWEKGYNKISEIKEIINKIDNLDQEKHKYIRDPLWGEIRLNHLEWRLLDSFFLQRLRHIVQMGGTRYVYPAANHKRFDHSLGTFGVISYILEEKVLKRRDEKYVDKLNLVYQNYIKSQGPNKIKHFFVDGTTPENLPNDFNIMEKVRNWIALNLKISMLMHDIGHYAYSHTFELVIKRHKNIVIQYRPNWAGNRFPNSPHETRTKDMILGTDAVTNEFFELKHTSCFKDLFDYLGIDSDLIAKSIEGYKEFALSELINGPLDADKMDYLARDNYFTMSPNQLAIFDRIYRLADINKAGENFEIFYPEKAISAIIKIIITRTFEYTDIVNHPIQLCFQGLFSACIGKTLINFDEPIQAEILKRMELMDDDQLLRAVSILAGDDPLIRNLLYALEYRELYKKVVIYNKSDFSTLIGMLEKIEVDSIFIDSDKIESFFKGQKITPETQSLIKTMKDNGYGIIIFFNLSNKKFTSTFEKILIKSESSNEILQLKKYIDNVYHKKYPKFLCYDKSVQSSVTSLLDVFNIIDDSLFIYSHIKIIGPCMAFFKEMKAKKLENFLIHCFNVEQPENMQKTLPQPES